MGEFFKGWRRKAGLVTLTLACAFLMLWFRSHLIKDFVTLRGLREIHHVVSTGGGYVVWVRRGSDSIVGLPIYPSWRTRIYQDDFSLSDDFEIASRLTLLGGEFATAHREGMTVSFWKVPYLWFVVPLTLLSARLILAKPLKATHHVHQDAPS